MKKWNKKVIFFDDFTEISGNLRVYDSFKDKNLILEINVKKSCYDRQSIYDKIIEYSKDNNFRVYKKDIIEDINEIVSNKLIGSIKNKLW